MEQLVESLPGTLWIVAVAAALGLLVLVLVLRLRRRASSSEEIFRPPGLPRAPRGLEPLDPAGKDEVSSAVRRSGAAQDRYFVAELPSGEPIAMGHTRRQPWVDVFVRRRRPGDPDGIHTGPYEVFTFSLSEERWSYGAAPPARREVEAVIREAFADFLTAERRL